MIIIKFDIVLGLLIIIKLIFLLNIVIVVDFVFLVDVNGLIMKYRLFVEEEMKLY